MLTRIIYFQNIKNPITFYIGKNKEDNFHIINISKDNDLWFHIKNESSCHIISVIPDNISKKEKKSIIKRGCLLCKQYTAKINQIEKIEVYYTEVKNIILTEIIGTVIANKTKIYIL
jgi:predicted ribosome quality control (RQC) complex YloA/Tae2 family protein